MESDSLDPATVPKEAPPTNLENKLCPGDLSWRLLLELPLPIARAGKFWAGMSVLAPAVIIGSSAVREASADSCFDNKAPHLCPLSEFVESCPAPVLSPEFSSLCFRDSTPVPADCLFDTCTA
jgi:hypothetical protein